MKKLTYILIALSTLAFSCTKSNIVDVPAEQKTPIAFDTYNGRIPVTKASEITKDNISAIKVYGFHAPTGGSADYTKTYMNPVNGLVKSGEEWTYTPLAYWPASGTLEFVAHGTNTPRFEATDGKPTPSDGDLVPVNGSYVNFTYTVPEATAAQQDLIAGYVGPTSATSDKVTFTMKHLLSRIGFTLKTLGTGADVTIKAIELHGDFINTGEVSLAAGTPAISTTNYADEVTNSYSLFAAGEYFRTIETDTPTQGVEIYARYKSDGTGGEATADTDDSKRYLMVIPGEITKAIDVDDTNNNQATDDIVDPYIKVVYQLSGASEQKAIIPFKKEDGNNWNLTAGLAYEFVLTVSVAQIDFTGSVEPWDETTPETPFY